jgi:hypothetical protein
MSGRQAKKLRKQLRQEARAKEVTPRDFNLTIPQEWLEQSGIVAIWVSAYQILFPIQDSVPIGDKNFRLFDAQVTLRQGPLQYYKLEADVTGNVPVSPLLKFNDLGLQQTVEGTYSLIQLPVTDEQLTSMLYIEGQVSIVAGMTASVIGRNAVYKRVFDQVYRLNGNIEAPTNVAPIVALATDFSSNKIILLENMNLAINRLPDSEQNRVTLSLRWFDKATHTLNIDAFLNYWFALETLGMPNTTNIRPINEKLAQIYGLGLDEVQKMFLVGRLQDLRSRIVHDGLVISLPSQINNYVSDLFTDLLFEKLDFAVEKRALSTINRPDFSLLRFFQSLN